MVLLGLGLGGYAWWVQLQKGQRILSYWGPRATYLIRHGERVELLLLGDSPAASSSDSPAASTGDSPSDSPAASSGDSSGEPASAISIRGREVPILQVRDITQVPGLVHARHTLIVDSYYEWGGGGPADCVPEWTFALRFSSAEPQETATLVFAPNCHLVHLLEADRELRLLAGLSDALADRSQSWFEQAQPAGPAAP